MYVDKSAVFAIASLGSPVYASGQPTCSSLRHWSAQVVQSTPVASLGSPVYAIKKLQQGLQDSHSL